MANKKTSKKKNTEVSYGVSKTEEVTAKKLDEAREEAVEKAEEEKPQNKVSLIDQIDEMKASGQVNTPEFREKMAKLEVVLGIDEISPFGTNEPDVFEEKLNSMTYADMRDMAYKVGLNPFLPHQRMKSALKKHFLDTNKNNMRNIMPTSKQSIILDPKDPKNAEALRILGDI